PMSNRADRGVQKYLARHAEPEATAAARLPGEFGHALVAPAYAEGDDLFRMLGSVPEGPLGRVVWVGGGTGGAAPRGGPHAANRAALERLTRELGRPEALADRPP